MPAGRLFNIVAILGSLTLALCIGVIQLFNQQVRTIEGERIAEGYASQVEYQTEMNAVADGYGVYEIVKPGGEGQPDKVTTRYYIPVTKAEQQVLDNPALLAGERPSRDWATTGTGKKVEEWGGLPGATPQPPAEKPSKLGDAKDAQKGQDTAPRDHRFAFTVSGEELVLLGEVPSDEVSKAIEDAAKKTHFGDKVRNKLKVTGAPGKPDFQAAYERGLGVMDLMTSGAVKWTAGKLSVEGFVPEAQQSKLEALTKAEGTPMGEVQLSTTEAADACDQQFAKALKKPIAFEGEPAATLSEKSGKVLDKLAAVAQECSGRIMIEGHSATGEDAEANKQLSLQQANAVSAALQERGVEKARLRAKGSTAADAAARIEVRIAR